ncbi:MAG: HAD-IIIA family hydrolase [Nanoarchaeota archaeon]
MKRKRVLICLDRDGTIIDDNHYFLGSQKNWKNKIRFLPGVILGLKLLKKKLPNALFYITTNQSGIAILDFPLLTEKRANEVNKYLLNLLKRKGIRFNGYESCRYVSPDYVKENSEYNFDENLIRNDPCRKPNPGMVKTILKKHKLDKRNTNIYVLGDRASDVQTALNISGFGILTPFKRKPEEVKKAKKIKSNHSYISKSFIDACEFIVKRETIYLYRFTTNGEGVFSAGKRLLPKELIFEVNERRKWLIKPNLFKGNYKFYLTEKGMKQYKKTLYLSHKKYLPNIKMEKVEISGIKLIIYEDEYQVVEKLV